MVYLWNTLWCIYMEHSWCIDIERPMYCISMEHPVVYIYIWNTLWYIYMEHSIWYIYVKNPMKHLCGTLYMVYLHRTPYGRYIWSTLWCTNVWQSKFFDILKISLENIKNTTRSTKEMKLFITKEMKHTHNTFPCYGYAVYQRHKPLEKLTIHWMSDWRSSDDNSAVNTVAQ